MSIIDENEIGTKNDDGVKHYHQFVDACLGNVETSAPFSYSARLTETILLGVIAGKVSKSIIALE